LVKENLQGDIEVMGALITMFDRRNRLARQVMKEVQDNFPAPVFDTVIPRSVRLAEAPSFGKSIFHFDSFSRGARSYKNLAREVIARSR
jgi:chromosome partitioning protein